MLLFENDKLQTGNGFYFYFTHSRVYNNYQEGNMVSLYSATSFAPSFSSLIASNSGQEMGLASARIQFESGLDTRSLSKGSMSATTIPAPAHDKDAFFMITAVSHHEVLEIKKDKLTATYIGKGRNSMDIGTLRSNRSWKCSKRFNYFEVKIENSVSRGQIYIGLSDSNFVWNKNPGYYPNSYGYRSDDGKKVSERGIIENYGSTFSQGSTVGCGLDSCSGTIFFTLNGKHLGTAFKNVSGEFSPTLSLHSAGESIKVNLGNEPFIFDLKALEEEEVAALSAGIKNLTLPSNAVNDVLYQYLAFQGYASTLQALGLEFMSSYYTHDPEWSALLSHLEERSHIRHLLAEGNIEEATTLCQSLFTNRDPAKPTMSRSILFSLKCQQWIELLRRGTAVDEIVHFMQSELVQLKSSSLDPSESDYLDKCVSLIAYEQVETCPFSWLLDMSQREKVADTVNAAIVCFFSPSGTQISKLELLMRQLSNTLLYLTESYSKKTHGDFGVTSSSSSGSGNNAHGSGNSFESQSEETQSLYLPHLESSGASDPMMAMAATTATTTAATMYKAQSESPLALSTMTSSSSWKVNHSKAGSSLAPYEPFIKLLLSL